MARYALIVRECSKGGRQFRAYDRFEKCAVFEWRGETAHFLTAADHVPRHLLEPGVHCCGKAVIWHMILAATAAQLVEEQGSANPEQKPQRREAEASARLTRRANECNWWPLGWHRVVAHLLFAHEGRHLRAVDVGLLLLAEGLPVCIHKIEMCLAELTARGLIQVIVVGSGCRFYDTDTRPHPHAYDADTQELRDIDLREVVELSGDRLDAAMQPHVQR